jgi:hypothetical protein
MVRVTIPVEAGNAAIKNGSLPKIITEALEQLKPEGAYFFANADGARCALMVFDLKEASDIPMIAEKFFMGFNAGVQFTPVMNADDLKKGLSKIS